MNNKFELRGSIVPLISPLKRDESLDVPALKRLVAYHREQGTDALFLLGTCGEGPCLSDTAKELVIETVLESAEDLPVLVGITETATRRAVTWLQKALRPGISAFVIMPPIFQFAASSEEHVSHVRALAGSTDIPLILYNLPKKCGGQAVPLDAVQKLAGDGLITGIKDSLGDLDYIAGLLKIRDKIPGFRVMNGELKVACRALELGVDGLVMSYTNVAPDECLEMINCVKTGNIDKAEQLQKKFIAVWNSFPVSAGPAAKVKAILAGKGLCEPYCCAPGISLPAADIDNLHSI